MSFAEMLASKTVWAAIGLLGFAVYLASVERYDEAVRTFFEALAAFGVRLAIAKQQPQQ